MSEAIERLNRALRDRYTLSRELGRGGMSTVYLAADLKHDRQVAIKVLERGLTDVLGAERFQREIHTTARLHHPHILPLFDSGEADGRLFYVMPVVDGESLDERLRREGTLAPSEAAEIVVAAADALRYAHDRGVVHRDVKPANILLHVGQTMITDFGISLVTGRETRLTRAGLSVGSPHYMSPEQVSEEGSPDGRTDQYALACVLYEMLEGQPPFPRASMRSVLAAHLVEDPPPLRKARNEELSSVIARAMAKDPGERFGSVTDFAEAVLEAVGGPPIPTGGERPGLVVLPFTNMSADPDNEYFSDGLTEEVIADLTHLRALRVISRTSAMRLKHTDKDVREIARELGVRYVLEGGVRKAGNALRITARLIDAPGDDQLWAEKFDGTVEDVFEIQEQVARAIVDALRLRLSSGEAEALADRPIPDSRAYESYLRARYEAWRFSREGLERARRYIDTALGIVGDNELLYGTLGLIMAMHLETGVGSAAEVLEAMEELTGRIFALNPDSARGHWIEAFVTFQRGELSGAIAAGERALALEADDPDTLILLGYVYLHAGRNADARTVLERAVDLDPLTPLTQGILGFLAVIEGRFGEAVEAYGRAREMDPESPFAAVWYGWALAYDRRVDDAVRVLESAAADFPESAFTSVARSLARGLRGDRDGAEAAITPTLEAAGRSSEMFARALAQCYAVAGRKASALAWLERAVELGMLNYRYLADHDRFLDNLRDDPRFVALLERVREASIQLE